MTSGVNVGVWVVVVGGGVVVVVIVSDLLGVVVVVVDGGVVVVVVGGGVVVVVVDGEAVVIVVGGGVELVVVVESLLVMVVDAVAFEHPMIEVIKTRLNRTKGKPEYLLFINAPLSFIFKFRFSNIIKNSRASVGYFKAFTELLPTSSVHL